jgi:hypothetical protein
MAKALGLNEAWYGDLEQRDEELASTLTLFQARELASALGVGLRDLVPGSAEPDAHIPLMELPDRIRAQMSREQVSIEQFEHRLGWERGNFSIRPYRSRPSFR